MASIRIVCSVVSTFVSIQGCYEIYELYEVCEHTHFTRTIDKYGMENLNRPRISLVMKLRYIRNFILWI